VSPLKTGAHPKVTRGKKIGLLLDLVSDSEDGSDMLARNIGLSPNYTVLLPKECIPRCTRGINAEQTDARERAAAFLWERQLAAVRACRAPSKAPLERNAARSAVQEERRILRAVKRLCQSIERRVFSSRIVHTKRRCRAVEHRSICLCRLSSQYPAVDFTDIHILKNCVFWDATPCGSCKN
jgi:hypothetical protein